MKLCTRCLKQKPFEAYYTDNARKDKLTVLCKNCNDIAARNWRNSNKEKLLAQKRRWKSRNKEKVRLPQRKFIENNPDKIISYKLKSSYNIDIEQYNKILKKQNYSCRICKLHESKFKKSLAVDHCHKTEKIRGLLCLNCNTGLGSFKDSTTILKKAIAYLNKKR